MSRRALAALALFGCGAQARLGSTVADNDPKALQYARTAERAAPRARTLAVLAGPERLSAWDLQSGRNLWSTAAATRSRIVLGTHVLAAREGDELVARNLSDGEPRWRWRLPGPFMGLASDEDRVLCALPHEVVAIEAGQVVWRRSTDAALGAPAVRRGIVYLPMATRALLLLDAATGADIARLRQEHEALTWVRALPEGLFYGGRAPVLLDDAAVHGDRSAAHSLLPAWSHAEPMPYELDGTDPVQAGYSALDRARLLWRAETDGQLRFYGPVVALGYRALFAYDGETGALKWVRRANLIAASHTGTAIAYATADGTLDVVEAETGMLLRSISVGGPVLGASFDADGLHLLASESSAPERVATLTAIAADREARFTEVKVRAVRELGRLNTAAAIAALVDLVTDRATAVEVRQTAADTLLRHAEPQRNAPIRAALARHDDRVHAIRPEAVELLARIVGATRDAAAVEPLLDQLENPATAATTIHVIATALTAIGDAQALPRLASFVLLNRCDPGASAPVLAVIDALVALGGPAEHELLRFVAGDERTVAAVAARVRARLGGNK